MKYLLLIVTTITVIISCKQEKENKEQTSIEENVESDNGFTIVESEFGTTAGGESVKEFAFTAEDGFQVKVITYGGIITSLLVPDQNGNFEDVVLGFESLADYEQNDPYFGALIGRYGNRIANAKFSLNGEDYELEANDGANHLHGGSEGFHEVVWQGEIIEENDESATLQLTYTSPNDAGGYPGTLETTVLYKIKNDHSIEIDYQAKTDKATIINLTQHSYFNLSGDFQQPILDHELEIAANEFLPVNETLIPSGEMRSVSDTPFDFTTSKAIGRDIEVDNEQLTLGQGFDHCWILNNQGDDLSFAASLYHPESGRFMEVLTTEPGIQFYSGNFLDGTLSAKGGGNYQFRTGLCLETQHYPDSPNQDNFPSTVLEPGETYQTKTTYKFTTK